MIGFVAIVAVLALLAIVLALNAFVVAHQAREASQDATYARDEQCAGPDVDEVRT